MVKEKGNNKEMSEKELRAIMEERQAAAQRKAPPGPEKPEELVAYHMPNSVCERCVKKNDCIIRTEIAQPIFYYKAVATISQCPAFEAK